MKEIEKWLNEKNGFTRERDEEFTDNEQCYSSPSGAFLRLNKGDNTEPPYWNLYYPLGDGEQCDESGGWDETPKYSETN